MMRSKSDRLVLELFLPEVVASDKRLVGRYGRAGVDTDHADSALDALLAPLSALAERRPGKALLPTKGYFANVLDIGNRLGLAITTDGVGSKILIAEMLNKFDTIGIDCVAMNVNDLICVGARPLALVDYLAVEKPDPGIFGRIGEGLRRGVEEAGVEIPGGEVAVLPEMIRGHAPGGGLDLVAAAVGLVPLDKVITGSDLSPGDVVIGLPSSGLHSNGYTLAREVLLKKAGLSLSEPVPALGCSLGEELLRPTRIYVRPILSLLDSGLPVKALVHITGDGFLNLARVAADVGFLLDSLPEPPPIFRLIREEGDLGDADMHEVYNMGIGFCVVVASGEASAALSHLTANGESPAVIGKVTGRPDKAVEIPYRRLIGLGKHFEQMGGEEG